MPQKSVTVYVVDDDESIRRALMRLLGPALHASSSLSTPLAMGVTGRKQSGLES
jgi:hypothetical protein